MYLRGVMAASAACFACAPAGATVVFHTSGTSDGVEAVDFYTTPLPGAGQYNLNLTVGPAAQVAMMLIGDLSYEKYESFVFQFSAVIPISDHLTVHNSGSGFSALLNIPEIRDNRNASGTGVIERPFRFPNRLGFEVVFQTTEGSVTPWALDVDYTAVPEPASWAAMLLGFGLAGASFRKKPLVQKALA